MTQLLAAISILIVIATLLPLVRRDRWWIRAFDFPRVQIAVVTGGILVGSWFVTPPKTTITIVIFATLGGCLAYQIIKIVPYTPVFPKQVLNANHTPADQSISLMVANVLQSNRDASRLLALLTENNPDVVVAIETDSWWNHALTPLNDTYPYRVGRPLDNTYGMMLFSRLELTNTSIEYIVKDDVPSIHTDVRLSTGVYFRLHALHPEPPYPKEAKTTTRRDAELLIVGRRVRNDDTPAIVAGDLNDVAWSYTTTLFCKTSGLMDPRIGRGLFNTFSARHTLLRWPLDHVFHSNHFKLVDLKRLTAFGSDHFPIFIILQYDSDGPDRQDAPVADTEEYHLVRRKISKAVR